MPDIYASNSYKVEDKAASFQMEAGDNGKVFVATAALTATLPLVANVWNGWNVTVFNAVDDALVVAGETGKLVTFNDVAANSVSFATPTAMVGTAVKMVYDSALTKWLTFVKAGETGTMTVST